MSLEVLAGLLNIFCFKVFIPKRLRADEVVATDAAAGRATEEVWAGAKASAPAMRATAMVAAVNFIVY
jgi:hypothetical protein